MSAGAKIAGLTRYHKKGEPGEPLQEVNLLEGIGLEGDFHQQRGGEKQVSLFSAEARLWMESQIKQSQKGLCFGRFRENILTEGLPLEDLENGNLLYIGDVILRISARGKHCHDECNLFSKGIACRLSESAAFGTVEQGGVIRVGDNVSAK